LPKKETLGQFVKNWNKFPTKLKSRIAENWQDYTDEVFAESQNKVPILSGQLQRSGTIKEARVTRQGVESLIVYNMPYANYIHNGLTKKGAVINLTEKGETVRTSAGTFTKARKGEFLFLENPAKELRREAIKDISDSISKTFNEL